MKKFLWLLLPSILLFCSCEHKNSEPGWNGDYNYHNNYRQPPVASFSYKVEHPLTVHLVNTSKNASSGTWDFGDGTTSTEGNPSHRYKNIGVYKIKLTAYNDKGEADTYEKNVTIEAPTKCYFAGVTYKKLSVNNKYVKFKMIDDDFFTTTWCGSYYRLLSTANLPFSYIFNEPVLMNGLHEDDWYKIRLYYSSSNSGDGTHLADFKFYTTSLKSYPTKIYWDAVNGNEIEAHFIWK